MMDRVSFVSHLCKFSNIVETNIDEYDTFVEKEDDLIFE